MVSEFLLDKIMTFRHEMAAIAISKSDDSEFAAQVCGHLDVARINLYAGQSNFQQANAIIDALKCQAKDSSQIVNVPR